MTETRSEGAGPDRAGRRYPRASAWWRSRAAPAEAATHPESDETVRVARAPRRVRRPGAVAAGFLVGLVVTVASVVWFVARPGSPPPPALPPEAGAEAESGFAVADEARILAARAPTLQIFRMAGAPQVLVLVFPSLQAQGAMLNRIGAFVEKAGLPRHRILTEPELREALFRSGDTAETYYYGHDYRVADIARFFETAARTGTTLRPAEQALQMLLPRPGTPDSDRVGAIISLPPEVPEQGIDHAARATILRHELSHGAYFTDPAYAGYSQRFWREELTEQQRAGLRRFLATEDYDTSDEDLVINEAQAYLAHTADRRFFDPRLAGMSEAEMVRLRSDFLRGMPGGWLKRLIDRRDTREAVPP